MKRSTCLVVGLLLGCGAVVQGTNRYVSLTGSGATPYTNWADAATNIQWAVDVAGDGDIIYITNGTYSLTNQIQLNAAITLEGFNGSSNTFINGNYPQTINRCFYLNHGSAIISGLTISNGYAAGLDAEGTNGGGVYVANGFVRSCVISSNTAQGFGGGVYLATGVITNSTITLNCAWKGGGLQVNGPFPASTKIQNCTISLNHGTGDGGGLHILGDAYFTFENCMISNNSANSVGGGFYAQRDFTAKNCVIVQNIASGGGGCRLDSYPFTFEDCLFMNNSAGQGGAIWAWGTLTIRNCTIVSNSATGTGGGLYYHAYTAFRGETCYNTIIYSNTAADGPNYFPYSGDYTPSYTNCCTMPSPIFGDGNITNYPQFTDWTTNNYRLTANSPCVNAGIYQDWMTNAVDLDGRRRIDQLNGRVDMGAYEFIRKITLIKGH